MQRYLKAFYGAGMAALAATQAAYLQAHHIGWAAGLSIALTAGGALAVIWAVPNLPAGASKGAG